MEVNLKILASMIGNELNITLDEKHFAFYGDVYISGGRPNGQEFNQYAQSQQKRSFGISEDQFCHLIGNISMIKVPPITHGFMGLDGITYELTIAEGVTQGAYQWWVRCPEEWKELGALVDRLVHFARNGLS